MILLARPASPFARKARVMIIEGGLSDQVEVKMFDTPELMKEEMPKYSPLGKIPALVLGDDSVLFDSKLICEYLDSLHDRDKWFPEDPDTRWQAQQLHMLADGLAEAVITLTMEKIMRPEEFIYQPAIDNQMAKITRALATLDGDIASLSGPANIGPLAVACALGYVDFRMTDYDWRANFPNLAKWSEVFNQRPAMQATAFSLT